MAFSVSSVWLSKEYSIDVTSTTATLYSESSTSSIESTGWRTLMMAQEAPSIALYTLMMTNPMIDSVRNAILPERV